jgi:NADH-quinone oxidoreductase subunit G
VTEVAQLVTVTIDGYQVEVPAGTLVIRAAEQLGIAIPRFCDHPLLDPVGACRQCLVEIGTPGPDGQVRWMPKPQASCTIPVSPGMAVRTQLTSAVADKAQQGIMEFLLLNHPLDCPVCDKGGECPLQNQAMSNGRPEARFDGAKRTYPKPIAISSEVLLDRERCVLCARCTRFSDQVAGDPFIELLERGALQQVGIYEDEPFESYFSGNTIQICPVGALTSAAYRFRARPFDLVSVPSACEHCASGCALRTDYRRSTVMRRLAGEDPEVNQEWSCDKGRFAFTYATAPDRLTHPLVRDADGRLQPASWPEALRAAARGLAAAADGGSAGVLVGGRVTQEDAYAYAKFARVALGTNNVDFRFREHSAEETAFLAVAVVGRGPDSGGADYAALDTAPHVLLVGFEPEEESPILFLRLRRAVRRSGTAVSTVASWRSRGSEKLSAALVAAAPGTEAEVLDSLADVAPDTVAALGEPGAIVLVGERLAGVPGGLSAALRLAERTGAALAWVPRRAGERGALDAGAFPTLLPGGRPVDDPAARVDVGAVWGAASLPAEPGLDTAGILAAAEAGRVPALVVGGVEAADLPDPAALDRALAAASFVVSLELRASDVHTHADVVFPVAPVAEKAGTFVDWEGRPRWFDEALSTLSRSDGWVLDALAAELGHALGTADARAARAELDELGRWDGPAAAAPDDPAGPPVQAGPGQAVLATWRLLLDLGRGQDEEPHLAGTAHPALARLSAATAAEAGVADGESLTVVGPGGAVTLPAAVTPMPDHVVWLPANSAGSRVHLDLGARAGTVVSLTAGGA